MESTLSIRFADTEDINTIGYLAQQIWPPAYGKILSDAQLEYMLNLFYNPAALRKQMVDEKQSFLMVELEEEPLGFAAWSPLPEEGIFKLHKLYVLGGQQGRGLGRTMLNFITDDVRERGGHTLRLNVNRYNKAKQFYEKLGFTVTKEEDINIGNDYWMNDYVMEKKLV